MQHAPLLSVGKLANANYTTVFDKDTVTVYNTADVKYTVPTSAVLRGTRDPLSTLWRILLVDKVSNINMQTVLTAASPSEILNRAGLENNPAETMCNVYTLRTHPEMVRYLHTEAGFPTKITWLKAIKKDFFTSWPGLTATAVERYFPESEETQKGHTRKMKSGICSTKRGQANTTTPSATK